MTVFLRALWYYLWIAPKLLQGAILLLMARRKLLRQFPMFFAYTALQIVQSGLLFAVSRSRFHFGTGYFRVYSVAAAISTAVRFGVIHELFIHFFRRYPLLTRAGNVVLRGAALVLVPIAVGLAFSAPAGANLLWNATFALDRTLLVLQCGLLISLFLFSRYFVLRWRSYAFGIALGLGVYATVELALSALRLYVGGTRVWLDLLSMGNYHVCVLIWLFYFWKSEKLEKPGPTGASTVLPKEDTEVWNRELERLLQ